MNLDNLLIKGNRSIADSPAIKAAVAEADEAAEEAAEAAEPAVQEKAVETPVDYNDRESVAAYIEQNPSMAKDAISKYERHIAGRFGSENHALIALQKKMADIESALSNKDLEEEDDMGLEPKDIKALDEVNQRLPGHKATMARIEQLESMQANGQKQALVSALKTQYGDIFTPDREKYLELVLDTVKNDFNNPVALDHMTHLGSQLMAEAAKQVSKNQKTENEKLQKRVRSGIEAPSIPPSKKVVNTSIMDDRLGRPTAKTIQAWIDDKIGTSPQLKHMRGK